MLFADIIGLKETKKTLVNAVKNNHVAHAQLFLGNEGGGNLALALAYAQYLNCTDKQETDSCGKCPSCIKYGKFSHPDQHFIFPTAGKVDKDDERAKLYIEWRAFLTELPYGGTSEWGFFLGAENKQLSISVDEARSLMGRLSLKAYEGEYKTVIFWLPELLNLNAANALLKVLEEPPAKTIFLLVATDYEKILTTILSRCQMVKIPRFSDEELSQYLQKTFEIDAKKSHEIALLAEGNLVVANNLVNEVKDNNTAFFINWLRTCWKNDYLALNGMTDDFQKMGRELQKGFFAIGLGLMRECLVWRLSNSTSLNRVTDEELDFISKFGKIVTEEDIERITGELNTSFYHVERNANQRIVFLDTSLRVSRILRKG